MKPHSFAYRTPRSPRRMAGLSLVELMIAMALGLVVMGALATLFANSSRARAELERDSRQIENGRFAMEILTEDLRLAGFYGDLNANVYVPPTATVDPAWIPDPCDLDAAGWRKAVMFHVQGFDNAAGIPGSCPLSAPKAGTDVLVVRRVSSCEAGIAGCPVAINGAPYFQVSKCATELANKDEAFQVGLKGVAGFSAHLRDCATIAPVRRYMVRVYYISRDNGYGQAVPTLKRLELDGGGFRDTPLVEGIEELNFEYGIDNLPAGKLVDGQVDRYTAAPATPADWTNVMAVRINLLARNIESSPDYTDRKTYMLGNDASGNPITLAPGGNYRRHAYSGVVRIVNAAQRRELP